MIGCGLDMDERETPYNRRRTIRSPHPEQMSITSMGTGCRIATRYSGFAAAAGKLLWPKVNHFSALVFAFTPR
jgi:hypothetical protein